MKTVTNQKEEKIKKREETKWKEIKERNGKENMDKK